MLYQRQLGIFKSTSSSFSGRQLCPPFGNWHSHNHHPNVSSTTSNCQRHPTLPRRQAISRGHVTSSPAWLSAPTQLPKPPSKCLHRSTYATVLSLYSRWTFPRRDRAFTAQYKKCVSTSPNESPEKTPDGCCRDWMTA